MPDGNRTNTCTWIGKSGRRYNYEVFDIGTSFVAKPGNYIFSKRNASGQWVAVYIGETSDLSERFDNHHAMPCIRRNNATHIHAHLNIGGKQARLNEETDIRQNYNPTCNKQ